MSCDVQSFLRIFLKFYFFLILFFIRYAQSSMHSNHAHQTPKTISARDSMTQAHTMHSMQNMHGMYGIYAMTRDSSGTAWLPSSTPMDGVMLVKKEWMLMFHGFSYIIWDQQLGRRGGKKFFDENMIMATAQRNFQQSILAFRLMLTLDPVSIGKCGYPLLFQTGETCNGKTPLIDRQHPHDFFMELAGAFTYLFNNNSSLFLYFGLPGEPALGPPVYFMRFSSEYIPEAPITHHWIDSSHITFGVATAGFIYNQNLKIELSAFKGREPDQHRFDIETPKFDSVSVRLSYNPYDDLALQASCGYLKSPEQLEPNVNTIRTIVSALYNKNFNQNTNWQTAAILGINANKPGHVLPGFLFETTYEYKNRHLAFFRFETVTKDELFVEPDPRAHKKFNLNKITLGYVFEFITEHIKWGLGALIDFPVVPLNLKESYGHTIPSYMIFLQMRLME